MNILLLEDQDAKSPFQSFHTQKRGVGQNNVKKSSHERKNQWSTELNKGKKKLISEGESLSYALTLVSIT